MVIEISFPRGGRKPPIHKTAKVNKVKYDLFGKKKQKPKKVDIRNQMGLKKTIEENVCPDEIIKKMADLISYRSIQEGMVVIGCVREIQKMTLNVLLPGRVSGRVMITQISTPYTKLLQQLASNESPEEYHQIQELFQIGQYVATKIVKINGDDDKFKLSLSLAPQDVNSELSFKNVAAGMLLWGAISGIEDHGYVIDLGINSCRAFLPNKNVDDDKKYYIGQLLWCVVQKSDVNDVASTVTINTRKEKIESTKIIKDTNLDNLMPGMQIDLTISKILPNGLEGKYLNDFTGYVHEGYLKNSLDKLSSYKVEQIVTARIMYITPITKLTFLSLKKFDITSNELTEGTRTSCCVISVTRGGLYVKINKKYKGFVSFKRLKTRLSSANDLDYNQLVKKNYPVGSNHQCRILDYDFMEQIYICSMEKDLINEKIFSYNDLQLAQNITVDIREIQKNGLLVDVGRLTGFILNEHLTDAALLSYANIKNKFNVGQKLKAKIWNINKDNDSLLLTIKPSLLQTENCLTSYENAEHNKQFPGIVVQITKNGLLVVFFGNVKGWVPKNQLSFERVQNPEQMFKIGQVVNCTVINCQGQKLTLSLQPPKSQAKKKQLCLGQHVDVVVKSLLPTALEVKVIGTKANAVVPMQQLTHSPNLAEVILQTYSVGDIVKNLVCINTGHGTPILSLRENKLNEENLLTFNEINPDTVLRCSVNTVSEKCLLLQCPILIFSKLIVVKSEHVCDLNKKITNIDIKKNQCIYAKVTTVNKKKQNVFATTELSNCWDGDLTFSQNLISNYLSDLNYIKMKLTEKDHPLTKFKLGEVITTTISHIKKNNSLKLTLPNEVNGIVDSRHAIENLKVGDEVKAVVLYINFPKNCVELTLKPNFMHRINQKQNGKINIQPGKNGIADVMLVKQDFVLVSLRGNGNRQLAYLPTRLHTNDLLPNTKNYNIGDEIKVEILQTEGGIIAIAKELKMNFEKALKAMKRARNDSVSSQDGSKKKKLKTEDKKNKKSKKKRKLENEQDKIDEQCKKQKMNDEDEVQNESEVQNSDSENEEMEEFKTMVKSKLRSTAKIVKNKVKVAEEKNISNDESKKKQKNKTKKVKKVQEIESKESDEEQQTEEMDNDSEEEIGSDSKEEMENGTNEEMENESDEEINSNSAEKMDSDSEEEKTQKVKSVEAILSGVNNFWEMPKPEKIEEESSEDENKEEELNKRQKKKKLTPAERAELARIEEERLRKIETELADTESAPKSADQFDRLVLANPNSSMLWINYIAFHLEGTEIEKARAIARKALNTIEFREEQEKLNVWIAFLNLENRYGSNESFLNILEEAVKMNDALTVHLQALHILAESNKTTEFLELLNTVTKRYKQDSKMWTSAAEACYKCDQKEQARNLMQRSIKSLDEKQHINVIVQFAFMESKWGEPERAEAILEKILASYPKRVDVWCSYIDMLIKSNRTVIARNVLERAVSQKLPPRKMKTIFSKFVQFETKFGDQESVQKVRQLATEYVKDALK